MRGQLLTRLGTKNKSYYTAVTALLALALNMKYR